MNTMEQEALFCRPRSGRRILISGGAGKIGRQVVNLYRTALPNAQIGVADLPGTRADRLVAECPQIQFFPIDFLAGSAVLPLVDDLAAGGQLSDLIVLHGGLGDEAWEMVRSTTALSTEEVITLNLTSVILLASTLLDRGVLQGTLDAYATATFTSSLNRRGGFKAEAYSAAKAGLIGAVAELASSAGPTHRVRVNAIEPGTVIDTWPEKQRQHAETLGSLAPLGRYARAIDVARAFFTATELMCATTGAVFPVDGGQHLMRITPRSVRHLTKLMEAT